MHKIQKKKFWIAFALIAIMALVFSIGNNFSSGAEPALVATDSPTASVLAPKTISIPDSLLKDSVIAPGVFLPGHNLLNGDLPIQVNIFTVALIYFPS